ncbi:MAG: hypothetical protein LBR50_05165 [Tannerella sp.]|jgi:hypothetical protein|nr:hypothetical protein [Tannerella sp.]
MKTIFNFLVLFAAIGCMTSCEKDDDKADARDAYIGSFKVTEQCVYPDGTIAQDSYNITIVKSSVNDMDVVINNIINSGESVNATINSTNFTIPQQTITAYGYGVSGSGRRDGNSITFSVLVTMQGIGQVNFSCTGNKQ